MDDRKLTRQEWLQEVWENRCNEPKPGDVVAWKHKGTWSCETYFSGWQGDEEKYVVLTREELIEQLDSATGLDMKNQHVELWDSRV